MNTLTKEDYGLFQDACTSYSDIWYTLCMLPLEFEWQSITYIFLNIGSVLAILAIVISIFGRIEGDYKWLVLNQALFELFYLNLFRYCHDTRHGTFHIAGTCLDKIKPYCETYFCTTKFNCYYYDINLDSLPDCNSTEFFQCINIDCPASQWWREWVFLLFSNINDMPLFALFLLTLSRFLCIFANSTYERIFARKKFFLIILLFDVLTHLYNMLQYYMSQHLEARDLGFLIYTVVDAAIKAIICAANILMSVGIIVKIAKQIKIHIGYNQKQRLKESLKVAIAISLQNVIAIFFVAILMVNAPWAWMTYLLPIYYDNPNSWIYVEQLYLTIDRLNSIDYLREYVLQLSIIFNLVITLFVMQDYRLAMWTFVKFLVSKLKIFGQKIGLIPKNSIGVKVFHVSQGATTSKAY